LQGDAAKANAAYSDLLTLWKDAGSDIPILVAAKAEHAKLKEIFTAGGGLRGYGIFLPFRKKQSHFGTGASGDEVARKDFLFGDVRQALTASQKARDGLREK
jgi:hypothetical protein